MSNVSVLTPASSSSSLQRYIEKVAKDMDQAIKEENKKYLQDNHLQDDKEWKYKPYKPDPRWYKKKVKDFRAEGRQFMEPEILLDPPSEDESDIENLQKVVENWFSDDESEADNEEYESNGSFGTNES
ncbi:uncharacterized protein EV420DRAFT_1484517 [Desarmillaria tabescens]|uniref:Uncharacterized protein n=1 Tax=Armillaria tabescens TaxID=1929756 RepID=A0AA39JNF6_ARMTA|nr:uncharacterized protein EV420DRAFT_1484517 [Desarmillaria tabescens]KAK0444926.1 hypothetical protein EV420DRAFT_1484517 [Desarmillaria tabescens]